MMQAPWAGPGTFPGAAGQQRFEEGLRPDQLGAEWRRRTRRWIKKLNDKLIALRERLVEAQHKLLAQAAEGSMMPSDSALRRISDLEGAIAATEVMIQEQEAQSKASTPR